VTPVDRQAATLQVVPYLREALAAVPMGGCIAAYVPHQDELDPVPGLSTLQDSGFRIALPVIPEDEAGGVLAFHTWRVGAWDDLHPGRHGIPVPRNGSVVIPDALIVPLVAFTRRGERLGYGGGWYDRTLRFLRNMNPDIPAIGLAFACQEADILPVDPWDEVLTGVVTEDGIRKNERTIKI
jgi:5-formyltetrahydrofolate cyclo-ligase